MRHLLLTLLSLTLCVLLAVGACLVAADPPFGERISFSKQSSMLEKSELRGSAAAGCASTACHGGPRPGVASATATRGAEYPLWLNRDPHAQAYQSLSSELGTRILQRLSILDGSEIVDRKGFNNCLACHNSTKQTSSGSIVDFRMEGVACDRCHGPSQAWRSAHYTDQWPALVAGQHASDLGFVTNQDLLTRARMCASCHIGDRNRNMNHDMISAGHPPLLYEFTTYHNRLPKHWRDPRSRDSEHYESTLWFVGQIAALEAQVALIESRAESAANTKIWPEFAHLDCAGCHQPLTADRAVGQSSNRARWSRWHRWGMETILKTETAVGQVRANSSSAAELRVAMEKLDGLLQSSVADRRAVQDSAGKLQVALSHWVDAPALQSSLQKFSAAQLKTVLMNYDGLSTPEPGSLQPNWESLSQLYLAGLATRKQWADFGNKQNNSTHSNLTIADQLRKQLLFSPNKNVPQFQLTSTATQDSMTFLKALQQTMMQPTKMRTEP